MDTLIFQAIYGLSHRFWFLDYLGIFLAQYLPYFLILITLFLILNLKKWQEKIYFISLIAFSVIISRGLITEIIRFVYDKPRPFAVLDIETLVSHISSPAFPSGHAAAYFALASAIFFLNKKWGIRFLIAAALMALGRIFVGVHWPADVFVGALIGILSAVASYKLLVKYDDHHQVNSLVDDNIGISPEKNA
ncbi:MAG: phosphatase PAP2 family protein [Patescibacteria group bacterium]